MAKNGLKWTNRVVELTLACVDRPIHSVPSAPLSLRDTLACVTTIVIDYMMALTMFTWSRDLAYTTQLQPT